MKAKDNGAVNEEEAETPLKNSLKIREKIRALELELAIKKREHLECINKMLVNKYVKLSASNNSLKGRIVLLVTENEQLKAKVKVDCAKSKCSVLPKSKLSSIKSNLQPNPDTGSLRDTSVQSTIFDNPWASKVQNLKNNPVESTNPLASKVQIKREKYFYQKEGTLRNLPLKFLARNLVLKPIVEASGKSLKEKKLVVDGTVLKLATFEPIKRNTIIVNLVNSLKNPNMQQNNKRRRSDKENKIIRKKRKTQIYTCSNCGQFNAPPLITRPNGLQHKCIFLQKNITFTSGKLHIRYGTLVLQGSFSEKQMKLKLEQARSLSQV